MFNERGEENCPAAISQGKLGRARVRATSVALNSLPLPAGWSGCTRHVIRVDGEQLSWPIVVVAVDEKAQKIHMDGRPAQADRMTGPGQDTALTFGRERCLLRTYSDAKIVKGRSFKCENGL